MSKVRDFNLLKVADVSSNSTNTNSVSVVVNADSSGNSQSNNDAVNFHQQGPSTPMPTYREAAAPMSYPPQSIFPNEASLASQSEQLQQQLQELELENKFYKLLSQTLSNLLANDDPKLLINLIDQSGKIIIEGQTLIELIAIKTNTDKNLVNISFVDEEPNCFTKVSPIKRISKIKINDESFPLRFNREYNILQDDYKISLDKCIIPQIPLDNGITYHN